jgi:hypothetical protein
MVDYGWNYPLQDYSKLLMAIGGNFGEVKKRGQVGSAMAGSDGDMQAAAKKLLEMGRVDDAAKILGAAGLADYRGVMAAAATAKAEPSFEERLLAPYLQPGAGSVEPFRLGPDEAEAAEASGAVPPPDPNAGGRPSLETAPKKVQDILGSTADQKRWEEEGKGAGQRNSFRTAIKEAAPQVNELVKGLVEQVATADNDTFENALGPWQGAGEAETLTGAIGQFFPQTAGSINNWWEQGQKVGGTELDPTKQPGGYTQTLRSKINATSATLVGAMQRLLRIPGIGAQSDYELRQIIAQAGDLNKSRTKADFQDKLSNVLSNLKALGFPVEIPSLDQVTGKSGTKFADRLSPEGGEAPNVRKVQTSVVRPDGTVEPPAASMIGEGPDARRVTQAPPKPPAKAMNALKAYINNPKYRDEAIRKFEEIYGEGAAQLYLGLGGR